MNKTMYAIKPEMLDRPGRYVPKTAMIVMDSEHDGLADEVEEALRNEGIDRIKRVGPANGESLQFKAMQEMRSADYDLIFAAGEDGRSAAHYAERNRGHPYTIMVVDREQEGAWAADLKCFSDEALRDLLRSRGLITILYQRDPAAQRDKEKWANFAQNPAGVLQQTGNA